MVGGGEGMSDLLNKITQGDCLTLLQRVENDSVDLLLTDPPYNVSMRSNFHTMGRKGVDFGEWDKGFDQSEWLRLACAKVRNGGSAIVWNDYKNIGVMKDVLESEGFTVKELIIWRKTNPMPRNRDRLYVTSIEVALWAVKGKGWTFNRQRETYENAIFEYPVVNHKKRIHPTQKPIELWTDLLRIHSNEGDTVLDCFSGSGVTAQASTLLNRNYIAFELDEKYHAASVERLKEVAV